MQKSHFLPILLSLLSFSVFAQSGSTPEWTTRMEDAKEIAHQHQSDILMVFAGSDWCHPCMEFKKEILRDPGFEAYAKDRFVILYLDFPARKKNQLSEDQKVHNEALADRYNRSGTFPYILVLDADEHILGEVHYTRQSPRSFEAQLEKIRPHNKS